MPCVMAVPQVVVPVVMQMMDVAVMRVMNVTMSRFGGGHRKNIQKE